MFKSKRLFTRHKVNYDFMYSYNNKPCRCTILNISESGMLLKVPQILDIGDKLELLIEKDPYNHIVFNADVVHTDNNYVGVYLYIDDDIKHKVIRDFILKIKNKNKFIFR